MAGSGGRIGRLHPFLCYGVTEVSAFHFVESFRPHDSYLQSSSSSTIAESVLSYGVQDRARGTNRAYGDVKTKLQIIRLYQFDRAPVRTKTSRYLYQTFPPYPRSGIRSPSYGPSYNAPDDDFLS